jgi:hypothetical protein
MLDWQHEHNKLEVQRTGKNCVVPENPYIQMAYYLRSVHSTSVPEQIPSYVYEWESMDSSMNPSVTQMRTILYWANEYSPPTMRSKGFFMMLSNEDANEMLPGSLNEFFMITIQSRLFRLIATSDAGVLAARDRTAKIKVMFYKERWEDDHFYLPARVLTKWLKMKE